MDLHTGLTDLCCMYPNLDDPLPPLVHDVDSRIDLHAVVDVDQDLHPARFPVLFLRSSVASPRPCIVLHIVVYKYMPHTTLPLGAHRISNI